MLAFAADPMRDGLGHMHTSVPCGHVANDPGIREQRITQRKRLLHPRLRRPALWLSPPGVLCYQNYHRRQKRQYITLRTIKVR